MTIATWLEPAQGTHLRVLCVVSYAFIVARCPGASTASFLDPILTFPATSHYNPEFGFSITSIKLKNKGLYKGSKSQSIFAYSGMKT